MRYEFRFADGRVCCSSSDPDHLCAACKEKLRRATNQPRRASGPLADYEPPSGYDAALAKTRRSEPQAPPPTPSTGPERYTPVSGYDAALAKMRRAQ